LLFLSCVLEAQVVINELMYHPPNDLEDAQFLELHNPGTQAADLSGWSFTRGITFRFPTNTSLPPGGFVVVARDRQVFARQYGQATPVLGGFTNRLSHGGERIELHDARGQIVDALKYSDSGEWPTAPDGYSASLERISPKSDSQDPANWAPSKLRSPHQPGGTPGRRNDNFSPSLPPRITQVQPAKITPEIPTVVRASIVDPTGTPGATLLYTIITDRTESAESSTPMRRVSGNDRNGIYEGAIPAQPRQRVVRWRIKAQGPTGAVRLCPSPNEPRPTFSGTTFTHTNDAGIPFAFVQHLRPAPERSGSREASGRSSAFGNAWVVFVPAGSAEAQLFDHVGITPRRGGFKIRFQKDRMFDGISTLNVVDEGSPRYQLSEVLAYELFRRAGVPAPIAGHVRLWENGTPRGCHLTFEQPNGSFVRRNGRDPAGNLYKSMYGNYEKRNNPLNDTRDLEQLIQQLNRPASPEQWRWIESAVNVPEVASHYAVNQCIQNWDGYFNNHYAHRDPKTGKWELYPWDQDKTWGDYDGASSRYDWYSMPLTYGMNGDPGVGSGWWRGPGQISGPLLANPEFKKHYLARLREICTEIFTPETFTPFIDALEARLTPEIEARARLRGENTRDALQEFHRTVQSFRNQVERRRDFLLQRLK
jgi:hypothetical protein